MPLSGLDIYKLLPKTNCKECGFATCLAFAMQLAKKTAELNKCPYLSPEAQAALEASSLPPIRLVTVGQGERRLEVGNETVLFRHEEKFHHPCGLGFIIEDSLPQAEIIKKLQRINRLSFERVGQQLNVNLIAVRQNAGADNFIQALRLALEQTSLGLVLMSRDPQALAKALEISADKKPLIYNADKDNLSAVAKLAQEFKAPLAVYAKDLDSLSGLTQELNKQGVTDLVLETADKGIAEKIWDLTQIRRQALKKSNRSLGYPALVIARDSDPYTEAMAAATYIAKYASIVLLQGIEAWEALALLTLRQNIYTDPQKPLQVEPKLYPVGSVTEKSPVLVTTNFSLTYYTVLGEVEASKIPAYIISVNTEGMSVLTAWAAEKFTPESITQSINNLGVKDAVRHKRLIIPGYVAVMSGDLQDQSGYEVVVGPKEAAGLPAFLKNFLL